MKTTLLIGVLFFSLSLFSQEKDKPLEKLTYTGYYNWGFVWIKAGSVEFTLTPSDKYPNALDCLPWEVPILLEIGFSDYGIRWSLITIVLLLCPMNFRGRRMKEITIKHSIMFGIMTMMLSIRR